MRWVDACRIYPARCAVLPQLGGTHRDGYFDSLTTTSSGERVYVSVVAARMMAEALGYKRPGDESAAVAERDRLRVRVAELEAQREEQQRIVDAAQTLLEAKAVA